MIISHSHKFIFIKTRKTAGTSIELALTRHCGDRDVVTPLIAEDEALRASLNIGGPRNFRKPAHHYTLRDLGRLILKGSFPVNYHDHVGARKIRDLVGENVWNSYYKFAFERNPWDKMISRFFWRQGRGSDDVSIEEMLRRLMAISLVSCWDRYTIDDSIAVDFMGSYESLEEDIRNVGQAIGMLDLQLPTVKAKGQYRKDRRPYWDVLTQREAQMISKLFHKEIQQFGYSFYPHKQQAVG